MSLGQTLRALVTERLTAAAEDIFVLFEKAIAEYEEELCRSKEENQRKQQLLDQALSPKIHLVRGNVQVPSLSPGPGLNQETPETPRIKEEPEEQSVKQEEEQLPVSVPESSAVCVKTEESSLQQRQSEHREETQGETEGHTELSDHTDHEDDWEQPLNCSAAQMETEADGDLYNQELITDRSSKQNKSAPETTVHNGHSARADGGRRKKKKHLCPFCQKLFGRKESLQRHIRVHTGEKPYSCSACRKTFTQKGHLDQHQRTHSGEKPHDCSVCNRTFAKKGNLELHMRTHTGEKPYSCLTCKQSFTQKGHLDAHVRTHTGDKPYSCSVCGKTFAAYSTLTRHRGTHAGADPAADQSEQL